ncbi:MAG: hypothetical protein GXP14_07580, partial [Gammaproteobacteria bacterium]|nr:hypothetical protein [Gammaproteobacteria bacterium]
VLCSHWKLKDQYGGNPLIIATGFLVVAAVFLLLLKYQWNTDRSSFYGTCIVLGGSVLVELIYRGITKRGFILREITLLKIEEKNLKNTLSKELSQLLPHRRNKKP